jgi:protein-disulfide isomerase
LARNEGKQQKVNAETLNACITKQDDSTVKTSIQMGETLGVDATPAIFINGELLEGFAPLEDVYRMIDNALIASGQKPPPPPPVAPPQNPPAAKPGN